MQGGVYSITHNILYTYRHTYIFTCICIYTHTRELIWLQEPEAVGGLELVHLREEIYQKSFSGKCLNSKFASFLEKISSPVAVVDTGSPTHFFRLLNNRNIRVGRSYR